MGFVVTGVAVPIGVILGLFLAIMVNQSIYLLHGFIQLLHQFLEFFFNCYFLFIRKGLFAVCIAMACSYWISLCRMIRGEFIKHKESEYVLAAQLLGASDFLLYFGIFFLMSFI